MLSSVQTLVQRRFHALLMALVGIGFLLLVVELIGYQHYRGAQLIGLAAAAVGAILAFVGIGARAGLRRLLAAVFLVLALVGVFGLWEHNEDRLSGERRGPNAEQSAEQPGQAPPRGDDDDAPAAGAQGGFERGEGRPEGDGMAPPALAPLSFSGFCLLGAVVLFGRKDE